MDMGYLRSINCILRSYPGSLLSITIFRVTGRTTVKRRLGAPAPLRIKVQQELLNMNVERIGGVCAYPSKMNHLPFRRLYQNNITSIFRGGWKAPLECQDQHKDVDIWV